MRHRSILLIILMVMSFAWATSVHGANAVVSDCVNFTGAGSITDAVATANAGGGDITFTCTGTIVFANELLITDNVNIIGAPLILFDGNVATRLFIVNTGATLSIQQIVLQNGLSADGGAIYNNGGTVNLTRVTVMNNTASGNGGGVFNDNGTVTVNQSTFSNNLATLGGGIFHTGNLDLYVYSTLFASNFADYGAGIYNNFAFLIMSNAIFDGNNANSRGGAIQSDGTVSMSNVSFHNNIAGSEGGAFFQNQSIGVASTTMTHVSFSANTATTGAAIYVNNGITTVNYSLIAGTNLCAVNMGTLTLGTDNLAETACASATVNGTLNLGAVSGGIITITDTSPAVDFYASPCSLASDLFATPRPQGSGCDVGVHEVVASTVTLNAMASCVGNDLQVNIIAGDTPFQITASSGTLATGLGTGIHTITGPVNETGVNVTELAGDTENFPLGDFNCVASTALAASAVCVGNDLHVTISNGDTPFQITASSGTLATGLGLGTHIITGPVNETGVNVTELAGDTENFPLGNFNCVAPVIPEIPATTVTVLGCALDSTDGVEVANAPDNTYCRVLMKNGGVVSYSGAIPADLIGLGVILAVDVYRLEGGMSVNTFPDYARVCLAGQGRLFYMDSRNAPRVSIELASESVDGLTCGWIPAPGTLILTN